MDIPKTNSHHWLMGGLPWPGRGSVWAPDSWSVTFINKEPQTPNLWYGSMWTLTNRKTDCILHLADYLWW
jgi:hypothetical protein